MKARNFINILRLVSLTLLLGAVLLTILLLIRYSRIRGTFPVGTVIAGIPVGSLNQQQAADRLVQAYGVSVEIYYGDAVIQMKPATADFKLDLESMLAAADIQRVNQPFWNAFWDYLWNRLPTPKEIPLRATISKDRLRSYLVDEITPRYDKPATAAISLSGSPDFQPGQPGTVLDIDRAMVLIEDALRSPTSRRVNLTLSIVPPSRPSMQNLQILLQRILELQEYQGLAEIYLLDLQTRQEIHFAYYQGSNIQPDIAFTAASTIKIPVMISTFIKENENISKGTLTSLGLMIDQSENEATDQLMTYLGGNTGPLLVTDNIKALGLKNTFIAGYFKDGAPLLKRFLTPANQRTDITAHPDPYNQTTPAEIAMLLDDIYQCSQNGGGSLVAVFPGLITQNECNQMITYLAHNDIMVLIQAGLPEGTQIAHKHGWIMGSDGVIHNISDAGIVYTPGGNYIFTIYLYDTNQLLFDPMNKMVAQISKTIYNYFNMPNQ